MRLEGRAQKLMRTLYEEGRVKEVNLFENKEYIASVERIKIEADYIQKWSRYKIREIEMTTKED